MEFSVSHPHGAGAAITVTTKIIQSESSRMEGSRGRNQGFDLQEAEQQQATDHQQNHASIHPGYLLEVSW